MVGLQIQLLGGFNISFEESPVSGFHQPRLQALSAYLLLNRHAPQLRSSIAFLFWPDSSEKQARTNLRRLLHSLRRALPHSEDYLALTTQTIQWRNDVPLFLDVAQFEAHLQQAAGARGQEHCRRALQAAIDVYSGDLLPGFHDDWLLIERERLQSLYTGALMQLSALYQGERDYPAAVEVARRLLNADTMQESTYRLLMELHLLNDDRAAALAVYHRCTTMLAEELGVDPSPLTEQVYQQVLQMERAARERPRDPRPAATLSLIGRRREWGLLEDAWRQARNGGSALFLIQGEAGIGKTRLAEELFSMVRRQGIVALQTRAYAAEGAGPYSPLVDLLRSEAQRRALERLERVWLAELARVLPELRAGQTEIPVAGPMTEAWQRQRFHEALVRGVLAAGQPLLIHFDDLQWADPETLAWLRFLLTLDDRARLLVVGTVRDDEIAQNHPLNKLRYDLEQQGRCRAVTLDPLDHGETVQLAAEVVGKALSPGRAETLFAESEGNPLFLIEMLQAERGQGARTETGRQQAHTIDGVHVEKKGPPKIDAVVRWRLAQLAPEARQLAMTAAVIGRRFSHGLLAAVSDLPEQELVRSLDALWQRRIIREGEAAMYDFSHDRLREAAYEQISPMQRRYLHRRVAQALQTQHLADFGSVAGHIAHHYQLAGAGAEARPFFEEAGRYAAARFANEEAADYFDRALALARKEGAPDAELAALHGRVGRALELASQFERAGENYQEMERLARHRGSESLLLLSQVAQATLLATPTALHDPQRAKVLAEQALSLARRLGDEAAEARVLWILLLVYGFTGRLPEAAASGERALVLARKLGLRQQMAFVLNDLGYRCYRQLGRLTRAREALQEAAALWRELDNLPMLADSLSSLCTISVDTGDYDQALAYSAEAHQISKAIGNQWGQAHSLLNVGWVHWEYGRPDRAIATMEECIRLGERAGFLGAQTSTRGDLSLVYADMGAGEQSLTILRTALSLAEAQFPAIRLEILARLAQLHLEQGRLIEAEAALEQVQQDPRWKVQATQSTNFALANLALKQGKHRRALAIALKLVTELRESEARNFLPQALYLHGRILQAAGQRRAARHCLREAQAAAATLNSRRILWQALSSLSQLEDDPVEAQRLRREAREIVEFIADHAGSPELRTSFLERPAVRDVMGR